MEEERGIEKEFFNLLSDVTDNVSAMSTLTCIILATSVATWTDAKILLTALILRV